jgi:hypothetical protein
MGAAILVFDAVTGWNSSGAKTVIIFVMKRFIAVALGFALGIHGPATWSVIYACQMSGEVAATCCCETMAPDSACPVIEAVCQCCDTVVIEAQGTSAETGSVSGRSKLGASVAATADAHVSAAPPSLVLPKPSVERSANGPPGPAFLIHQSFRC